MFGYKLVKKDLGQNPSNAWDFKVLVGGICKLGNLSETDFTTSLETIISKLSNSYEN